MAKRIIPRAKPRISKEAAEAILRHHFGYQLNFGISYLIGIRGYYLNSIGERNKNDLNVYDDALLFISPNIFATWNFNTDPSFLRRKGRWLAKLDLGVYQFYRDYHLRSRGRSRMYRALRAYPEGGRLPCTRNGKPSLCSFINLHKGASTPRNWVTHSDGCQTVPDYQYDGTQSDFCPVVWDEMDKLPHSKGSQTVTGKAHKLIDYVLVENRETGNGQKLFDHEGKVIKI